MNDDVERGFPLDERSERFPVEDQCRRPAIGADVDPLIVVEERAVEREDERPLAREPSRRSSREQHTVARECGLPASLLWTTLRMNDVAKHSSTLFTMLLRWCGGMPFMRSDANAAKCIRSPSMSWRH